MSTDATEESEEKGAYEELVSEIKTVSNVKQAAGVLRWDQQVMMPEGGTPARSQQMSALSAIQHDLITDEKIADLLDEIDEEGLSDEKQAVVREVRRNHERQSSLPRGLVQEISKASSEALPKWKKAKKESDFEEFAPQLEKMIELKKEYARNIDPDRPAYEILFEDYEPYLSLDKAEEILEHLKSELVPLIDEIRASDKELAVDSFNGTFDTSKQEDLARTTLDILGYPWERGRLDTAPHPFSSGNQFDARITTRFDENDPISALTSTIHEFGHATYNLGLPKEHYGTPLGMARELTIHESQSRLWENHVGRSREFWHHFLPEMKEEFSSISDVTVEEAYEAANQVYDDNPIRVEADELTYHMHIIVRFEIERELIEGDLEVDEIPQVWNNKMDQYLGVRPENDAEGCLQDIHWSHGSFGYFSTYSLGSVLAAQIFDSAREEIDDLSGQIIEGEFDDLHDWLTENIYSHGQRYKTDELIKQVTGESFTADYFIDYVKEKYGELYDL